MSIAMPGRLWLSADDRELLLTYLRAKRGDVVRAAEGLDDDQLRWRPDGRLLPIIGIINHLTHVEERWIDGRCLGLPFPARTEEFELDHGVTGADVIAAYAARAARTDELVRSVSDLRAPCLGCEGDKPPAHVILELGEPVDLRWVLLHLIEETAHHAGHADATRELLDGKRAPELLALVRDRSPVEDEPTVDAARPRPPAELVLRYLTTVINERQTDRLDDFIAPGYRSHGFHPDREALRSFLEWQAETARDWVIDVQDVVADGGRVAVRAVASGTRAERSPGQPYDRPMFRRVEWITIYRVESDLIAEAWVVSRNLDDE